MERESLFVSDKRPCGVSLATAAGTCRCNITLPGWAFAVGTRASMNNKTRNPKCPNFLMDFIGSKNHAISTDTQKHARECQKLSGFHAKYLHLFAPKGAGSYPSPFRPKTDVAE